MTKPIVAIIGRQNVGKSTLLNRLAGKRIAIVEDLPGTTRDRVFADAEWEGRQFTVVDTGGLEIAPDTEIGRGVRYQVEAAVRDADIILFLTDVKDGVMPIDFEIADMLRAVEKPIIVAVNKVDNNTLEAQAVEFYQLGLGDPIPISAHHARGTAELRDEIVSLLPPPTPTPTEPEAVKIAIVGRPNVGKSALLNAILGHERSIVSATPGTTRDAIDTPFDFAGTGMVLIDTAGIRRRGSVDVGVEHYSVLRALRAIDRCDVAVLVLDASEMVTAQDMHVGGYIQQAYKGIVIVVNKWDLVTLKDEAAWIDTLRNTFKFVTYAPVLFTSALKGQGVAEVISTAYLVYTERGKRISDVDVRSVLQEAVAGHAPPHKGKRELVVRSGSQTGVQPPTFTIRINDEKLVHFSYRRYLENRFRAAFGFTGTPIRLVFNTGGTG